MRLLHSAAGEACYVVFALLIHRWHLGCLAADEGATCLPTPLGYACYDLLYLGRVCGADGYIIEEKQRFGSLCQHVVDTHSHGVDADSIVSVEGEGYLEFGTYAVGTADQYGFFEFQCRQVEHTAKGSDITHHAESGGRRYVFFYSAYYLVACLEINACLLITYCHIL